MLQNRREKASRRPRPVLGERDVRCAVHSFQASSERDSEAKIKPKKKAKEASLQIAGH